MARLDWQRWPNFSKKEFDCKHTGKNRMNEDFMDILQQIRNVYNRPMIISSGYRDVSHPVEEKKKKAGEHTFGLACDVLVSGTDAIDLMVIAYGHGIRRIGLKQKGAWENRFIHLGYGDKLYGFPEGVWTY